MVNEFHFCIVEDATKEKCDTLLPNHMQCPKKVSKFVSISGNEGRNYCEAHFQIQLAAAQRAGLRIANANDDTTGKT